MLAVGEGSDTQHRWGNNPMHKALWILHPQTDKHMPR